MTSIKDKTLTGTKWASIEKVSVQGIQFVLSIVMARMLSPSDYGMIGMLGVFLAVSQTFIDGGFTNALVRKIDRTQDDYSTVFYFNIAISIVCYLLLFISAPFVADFYHTPLLCSVLRVQSVSLIINSLIGVQITQLTIELNFKALAIRSVFATIISGIIGIVLAYLGFGVWSLVAQNLISCLVNLLFIWIYCRWTPSLTFSKQSFDSLFSFGSKLLFSNVINKIYTNIRPIIIGRFFSSADLGVYTRGCSFVEYPIYAINGILEKVTFPILATIQDDLSRLIQVYRKYIAIVSLVNFFVCLFIASCARPLVLLLLTDKWESSIIFLQIICFSLMFDHICTINLNLLMVKGYSNLVLKLEVFKKTMMTLVLFASIPFGVVGICVSSIITTQIAVFVNTYYTGKEFGYGYLNQIRDIIPFFVFSLLACLPAFLFTLLDLNEILSLIFCLLSAPLIYWILLRKNVYMIEVMDVVKTQINRVFRINLRNN